MPIRKCGNFGAFHAGGCCSEGVWPLRDPSLVLLYHQLFSVAKGIFISERAKQASSVLFVFNRDFRYVRIYIYLLRTPPRCSVEINEFELG